MNIEIFFPEMFCSVIVPLAISFAVPIQIVNNFFFIDLLRKALRRILWYSYDKSINLQEHIYKYVHPFILPELNYVLKIFLGITNQIIVLLKISFYFRVLVFIMLYYNLALPWLVIMIYEFLSYEAKIEKPMEM